MSISITRYVDIKSGVGAGAGVAQRSLILRVFTQHANVPAGAVVTFTNLSDVEDYFGTVVDEYIIASKYFAFVSKSISSPRAISYARWNAVDLAPALFGDSVPKSLTALNAVTAGNLNLTVDGVIVPVGPINLAAAGTLAAVATAMQTAVRAAVNPQLVTATVSYDTNNQRFILTGTVAGSGVIDCVNGAINDLGGLVGWSTKDAVSAPGTSAQTATQAVSTSASNDDNFGSFVYGGTTLPTDPEMINISGWNATQNNKFMFCVPATVANVAAKAAAMAGNPGTAITLGVTVAEHAETMPAEILAATDYSRPGASANFMYYQFTNRSPSVTNNSSADTYDKLRVNYLGQTQSAGQKISFYQRGYLQGNPTDVLAMNVYAGEQWLKSAMSATILSMFLNVPNLPANEIGRAQLLTIIQPVIDQATRNGVVAPGKLLTDAQKVYISQVTGNDAAWQQVQSKGYWVDAAIVPGTNALNGLIEYKAVYTLVYGKNDQIMSVSGSDVLI